MRLLCDCEDGVFRNLTVAEILDQLITIERELKDEKRVTHVVFMGMGEPLANYDQTCESDPLDHGCKRVGHT